jgi:hypothetical protein
VAMAGFSSFPFFTFGVKNSPLSPTPAFATCNQCNVTLVHDSRDHQTYHNVYRAKSVERGLEETELFFP